MRNGCRKKFISFLFTQNAKLFVFMCGVFTSREKIDFDYSFYLGPNYKDNYKKVAATSTYVSNHVSWIDTMTLYQYYQMALSLDTGFIKAPLMGKMAMLIDSIFLPRGSSEEKRQLALKTIQDRQEIIEQTGNYNPLLVFAEGGTTNNSAILKFRKGAFIAEKKVKPLTMHWSVGSVHPAYDTIEVLVLAILQLSWSCMKCRIVEMPDFEPNEYLFETHKDKGQERWEIYAWALRDAMMKANSLEACDMTLRQKMQYEGYM
jgi:hypothetical protein